MPPLLRVFTQRGASPPAESIEIDRRRPKSLAADWPRACTPLRGRRDPIVPSGLTNLTRESHPAGFCPVHHPVADNTVLTVTNLSVVLDHAAILSGISFELKQGEALAVIGPNGAGKTILFRALLGLVPYTGTVNWRAGAKISYVPQRFATDRSIPITVEEFFLLQGKSFWRPRKEFIRHLDHELTLVGLDRSVLRRNPGELSGGETQRLLVAWAMLQHPDVLLLDEPTAGMDTCFGETIYALLHRIQMEHGTTLLIISHDLNVVYRYAQRVLCLNRSIVCQGPPVEALNAPSLAALYGDSGYYRHDPGIRH